MSDEPALLAAIRAHPDEDTPRLVYADWLDENGQPERAEFIRLQCLPEANEVQADRMFALEERHFARWLVALNVPRFSDSRWEFRRGFPEYLGVEAGLFSDRFDAFARVPWLRSLSVYGAWNDGIRELCSRQWPQQWIELVLFRHVDVVDESSYDDSPALLALAGCPHIRQLRRLRLSGFDTITEGHPALASLRWELGDWLGDRLVID